ncbi:MAG: hypothetical protein HAW67_04715 [Endozoicomonadaceae bacterium]|nr:hypothetical protein [Endozoicomonadaceae bacterium]
MKFIFASTTLILSVLSSVVTAKDSNQFEIICVGSQLKVPSASNNDFHEWIRIDEEDQAGYTTHLTVNIKSEKVFTDSGETLKGKINSNIINVKYAHIDESKPMIINEFLINRNEGNYINTINMLIDGKRLTLVVRGKCKKMARKAF